MKILLLLVFVMCGVHSTWSACTDGLCQFGIATRDGSAGTIIRRFQDTEAEAIAVHDSLVAASFISITANAACNTENLCGDNSTCGVVSTKVFTCNCTGYFTQNVSLYGSECIDVDECADVNDNNCSSDATCTNETPGYSCACDDGFSGDGFTCTNIDECGTGTHNCSANANCIDQTPGYSCTCKDGFSGNGYSCNDTDECTDSTHNCSANANCTNQKPGFSCECQSGYTGDGNNCTDIKECDSNPCDVNAICSEPAIDTFDCTCNVGYTGNGTSCTDVDECASDSSNSCDGNATCTNTEGSYSCACNSGFSGDGLTCENIDDCDNHNCTANAFCTDEVNNYTCTCDPGWTGDGFTSCVRADQSICIDFTLLCDNVTYSADLNDTSSSLYINVTDALKSALETYITTVDNDAGLENITYSWNNSTDELGVGEAEVLLCISNTNMFADDFKKKVNSVAETAECGAIASADECGLDIHGCPSDTRCKNTKVGFCCVRDLDYTGNITIDAVFNASTFGNSLLPDFISLSTELISRVRVLVENKEQRGCLPNINITCPSMFKGSIVSILAILLRDTTLTIEDITNELNGLAGVNTSFGTILGAGDFDECVSDYDLFRNCSELADCLNFAGTFSCDCNATYYDNGTTPGEICISPITINCDGSDLSVSIIRDYYINQGISLDVLHLADESCNRTTHSVNNGDTIEFTTALNECNTTLSTSSDNTSIIASNYVTNLPSSGVFTGTEIKVPFECTLPADVNITARFNGTLDTVVLPNVASTGDFNLEFGLWDSAFSSQFDSTKTYGSNDVIYGQVRVLNSVSNVGVKLNRCWGTPTSSRTDSSLLEYITDGCSNGNAARFDMISNGEGPAKFSFQMFFFTEVNYVYLHCDVNVCTPSCKQSCGARRRRRDVAESDTRSVSLTLKLVLNPKDPMSNNTDHIIYGINGNGNDSGNSSEVNYIVVPIVSAILAFVLVVLLALLVIVVVKKQRSKNDSYDTTHVNMHAIGVKPPAY